MKKVFLLGVFVLSVFALTGISDAKAGFEQTLLPYQSSDYRYQLLPSGSTPAENFQDEYFDDSTWSSGTGAFGENQGNCQQLDFTIMTEWLSGQNLVARNYVDVPPGVSNVKIKLAVDNDIAAVYWNGVQVSGAQVNDSCPALDQFVVDVPQELVQQYNTVAFYIIDRGYETYFDATVVGEAAPKPVLIIPGIMGTEMYKGGDRLWASPKKMLSTFGDEFMDPLAMDSAGNPVDQSVVIGEVVSNPDLLFDYTQSLINDLHSYGFIDNETLHLFPYDWRKELAGTALNELATKLDEVAQGEKIDIIAHSQGGLLIKRLLFERPDYQDKIRKLIFIGTPHLGAPKAAKALMYGDDMGVSFLTMGLDPEELKRIGQNMPSVYELLPSDEYFQAYSHYLGSANRRTVFHPWRLTPFSQSETDQALTEAGLNMNLVNQADTFHSYAFDNINFISSGMEVHNLVGHGRPTIMGVYKKSDGGYKVAYGSGDGTVPLASAEGIGGAKVHHFYDAEHGRMMTDDATRNRIIQILASPVENSGGGGGGVVVLSTLAAVDTTLDGQVFSAKGEVEIYASNAQGKYTGVKDGVAAVEIPGSAFDVLGDEKFIFLPDGNFEIHIKGSANGALNISHDVVLAGETIESSELANIPVTPNFVAESDITGNDLSSLLVDAQNDGQFEQVVEMKILDDSVVIDSLPPVTSATTQGQQGQVGYFRSDVSLVLTSQDTAEDGAEASGVKNIYYKIGSQDWAVYTGAINFQSEGFYRVEYKAEDAVGNIETVRSVEFTIDKTAPEAVMSFDVAAKDLKILSKEIESTIADSSEIVTITDIAGNITKLVFHEKDRKKSLKAELKELYYNGVKQDVNKNKFKYEWKFKNSKLDSLSQTAKSKAPIANDAAGYEIEANFKSGQTKVKGRDKNGKVNQTLPGLHMLNVSTNKGVLEWIVE